MPGVNPEYRSSSSKPDDLESQVDAVKRNEKRTEESLKIHNEEEVKRIKAAIEQSYEKLEKVDKEKTRLERNIQELEKMLGNYK